MPLGGIAGQHAGHGDGVDAFDARSSFRLVQFFRTMHTLKPLDIARIDSDRNHPLKRNLGIKRRHRSSSIGNGYTDKIVPCAAAGATEGTILPTIGGRMSTLHVMRRAKPSMRTGQRKRVAVH